MRGNKFEFRCRITRFSRKTLVLGEKKLDCLEKGLKKVDLGRGGSIYIYIYSCLY